MSDRDIPSVPVTTLAGLTSLGDLLSELPISDSLSVSTSLNRSLLFHPRVAEEANNLLSIRDDSLVNQLVNAIEQTNSDHIELKDKYLEPLKSGTAEGPPLLQAILSYKKDVFNSQLHLHNQRLVNTSHQQQQPQAFSQAYNLQNEHYQFPQHHFYQDQLQQQQQVLLQQQQNQLQQQQQQQQQQFNQTYAQQNNHYSNIPVENVVSHPSVIQHHQIQQQLPQKVQPTVISSPSAYALPSSSSSSSSQLHQPQNHVQSPLQPQQIVPHNLSHQTQQQSVINKTSATSVSLSASNNFQNDNSSLVMQSSQLNNLVVKLSQEPEQSQHNAANHHQNNKIPFQPQFIHNSLSNENDVEMKSQTQEVAPRNNEYLQQQQQSKNLDTRGRPSPAQGSIAPETDTSVNTMQTTSRNKDPATKSGSNKNVPTTATTPATFVSNTETDANLKSMHTPKRSREKKSSSRTSGPNKNTTTAVVAASETEGKHNELNAGSIVAGPNTVHSTQALHNQSGETSIKTLSPTTDSTPLGTPEATASPVKNREHLKKPGPNLAALSKTSSTTSSSTTTSTSSAAVSTPTTPKSISVAGALIKNSTVNNKPIATPIPISVAGALIKPGSDSVENNKPGTPSARPKPGPNIAIPVNNKALFQFVSLTNLESINLKKCSVLLPSISEEDQKALQTDLKKFAETSPELAAKLGVGKKDNEALFSKMKEDEKRYSSLLAKRKMKEPENPEYLFSKPKLRKVEKKMAPVVKKMSKEELMKTNTYQRFVSVMSQIFEQLDETEAPPTLDEPDESYECIPSKLLSNISSEAAKLKARHAIDSIPENKLSLLINYSMRSVHLAKNFSAGDLQDDLVGDECIEKILNAVEASLLICNIYTSKSTKFMHEDNVDAIIKFVQFQLRETVFPSYDPVYSVETKKKVDSRKKKTPTYQQKGLSVLYSKIVELTKVLVTLFNNFHFVDTIIIHASALGVEPFFVDNIETLQFVCLDLVTSIFQNEKYSHHRRNILGDILSSFDRLPHSKRNLRPYKLTNNGGNIQMMTALVLQLIQCAVVLPENLHNESSNNNKKNNNEHNVNPKATDLFVIGKYDTALSIGGNFLTTFLNKCKSRSGETDFRPLFENFIHDLLTTVNKPEWPASELLLSLLGTMLVKYMSDKSVEQAIRVVSLEYLGIVAARLRKDTVESRCKVNTMDSLIKYIKIEQEKEGDEVNSNSICQLDPEEERTEFLQKILIDFLAVNAQEDNIVWSHARHFYLTQWYRDIIQRKKKVTDGEKGYASRKKAPKKRKKYKTESEESDDTEVDEPKEGIDQELNSEIYRMLDQRKKYYLSQISPFSENKSSNVVFDIKTYIDYSNANLIAQYLASKRSFSQSFDTYLQKIILVVREPVVAIRTRAMKCLGNIVEVDQMVLVRKDMQMGVQQKLLDAAISVREAAVDLVGKYILSDPDLIDQYYEMISQRILDTGVSVRKRVIKILRDICIEYPEQEKIPDICVKMIRRVNDEEGIQKLVMDVFMTMWFTPCNDNNKPAMERKITQIIDVVCSSHETGTQGFDGLLRTIFEPKENKEDSKVKKEIPKSLVKACQQIVNGLVNATMNLEGTENKKLVGCITALHLFAKIRPQLLVNHSITLEPYLNIKCISASNFKFISSVAEILEQVVPLMEHPSETFLADLEAHLMMLIVTQNQTIVISCVSCLAAVVNKITKNYKLVRDCFHRFYYRSLVSAKEKLISEPTFPIEQIYKPLFRRSLFTVGLIMRYFDFKLPDVYGGNETLSQDGALPANICDDVFETLAFFLSCSHTEICKETLVSMGSFCVKNFEYLTKIELRDYYNYLLTQDVVLTEMKINVLKNIQMYLMEEENKMVRNDKDWSTQSKLEDLKEMGDVSSGMASRVIQIYLKEILKSFLHKNIGVRLWAMRVIEIVLRQGLVHPVQIVPYLICLSTDPEKEVAHVADRHLQDIDKQYPGFVNMKSHAGMQLSFELQILLQTQKENTIVRGFRIKDKSEPPTALNGFLYSLLRNTKPQRRALVQSITKQFDDGKTSLRQMLYLADNLAFFPYLVQDEPLYIIHHIDVLISVNGTNLLSAFREGLKPQPGALNNPGQPISLNPLEDEDDEDQDTIYGRLPEDTTELQICITAAQGCMLLLILKQHLKDIYGITDSKISRYSPSEAGKIYDKAMQRRSNSIFNPKATITILKEDRKSDTVLNDEERMELVARYLDFKQLMLQLDPDDPDLLEEDDRPPAKQTAATPAPNDADSPTKQDNGGSHVNNVNNIIAPPTTPTITKNDFPNKQSSHITSSTTKSSKTSRSGSRKQAPVRSSSKKKKRKIISSSEEESDGSDNDYD